jgi:large subunit ribosomal protein L22
MQVVAKSKYIRISPRKLRLVADSIRKLPLQEVLTVLGAMNKRAAKPLEETLRQALGNAINNFNLKKEELVIKEIQIGKGPGFTRGRPVSRGRAHPILKRTSHITIILEGKNKSQN